MKDYIKSLDKIGQGLEQAEVQRLTRKEGDLKRLATIRQARLNLGIAFREISSGKGTYEEWVVLNIVTHSLVHLMLCPSSSGNQCFKRYDC
jgi:hypothetical protein